MSYHPSASPDKPLTGQREDQDEQRPFSSPQIELIDGSVRLRRQFHRVQKSRNGFSPQSAPPASFGKFLHKGGIRQEVLELNAVSSHCQFFGHAHFASVPSSSSYPVLVQPLRKPGKHTGIDAIPPAGEDGGRGFVRQGRRWMRTLYSRASPGISSSARARSLGLHFSKTAASLALVAASRSFDAARNISSSSSSL